VTACPYCCGEKSLNGYLLLFTVAVKLCRKYLKCAVFVTDWEQFGTNGSAGPYWFYGEFRRHFWWPGLGTHKQRMLRVQTKFLQIIVIDIW